MAIIFLQIQVDKTSNNASYCSSHLLFLAKQQHIQIIQQKACLLGFTISVTGLFTKNAFDIQITGLQFSKVCLLARYHIIVFCLNVILQIFMLCQKSSSLGIVFVMLEHVQDICFAKIETSCKIISTRSSVKLKEFTDLTAFERRLRSHQLYFRILSKKATKRNKK